MTTPQDIAPVNSALGMRVTRGLTGLDQAQFGRLLGVSVDLVSAWERGKSHPRAWVIQLCEAIRFASDVEGFVHRMGAAIEHGHVAGLGCLFRCREEAFEPAPPEMDPVDLLVLAFLPPADGHSYLTVHPYAHAAVERLVELGLATPSPLMLDPLPEGVTLSRPENYAWKRSSAGEAALKAASLDEEADHWFAKEPLSPSPVVTDGPAVVPGARYVNPPTPKVRNDD